jgi:hypothetical protein
VFSEIVADALGKAVTYFVDFLSLKNKGLVEQLLVTPMLKMYGGAERWVNEASLTVLPLRGPT